MKKQCHLFLAALLFLSLQLVDRDVIMRVRIPVRRDDYEIIIPKDHQRTAYRADLRVRCGADAACFR